MPAKAKSKRKNTEIWTPRDVTKCAVCGRTLPSLSRAATCSDKCRRMKARLGTNAHTNMMQARNALRYVIKGIELDEIDTNLMYEEYQDLIAVVDDLRAAYNARFDRERMLKEMGIE